MVREKEEMIPSIKNKLDGWKSIYNNPKTPQVTKEIMYWMIAGANEVVRDIFPLGKRKKK